MSLSTASIMVEIAPGELLDKITMENITGEAKRLNVAIELGALSETRDASVANGG